MKKKGFTLIELLVVIAIIAMLMAILMPALGRVRRLAQRLICGTNLKGLGTATMVYANDNDDEYPTAGTMDAEWASTGQQDANYWDKVENFSWSDHTDITVSASLYLLVRDADVSPKQFVCQSSDQKEFQGTEAAEISGGQKPDLTQLHDFGGTDTEETPQRCVSYSYQLPYEDQGSNTPAIVRLSSTSQAGMAIMADKNPWYDSGLKNDAATSEDFMNLVNRINNGTAPTSDDWNSFEAWELQIANSAAHMREGQNVLYNDGHVSFEKRSDVGVQNDGIYNQRAGNTTFTTEQIRIGGNMSGKAGQAGSLDFKSKDDNILVNDDDLGV